MAVTRSTIRTFLLVVGILCMVPTSLRAAEGQLLTIDVSDRELNEVLLWISRQAGEDVNVVSLVERTPPIRVTLRLTNVTWQEAVEFIARQNDLVIERRSETFWELTAPPRVRMRFQDARLSVVLEALARQAEVNLVISDDVDGSRRLTMSLTDVPWSVALDVIVRATGYTWIQSEYRIVRVVSQANVQADLETVVIPLNYTDGSDIMEALGVAMSDSGEVIHESTRNALVLTDTPVALENVRNIIRQLDRRPRQVQLELRLVEFSTTEAFSIGFNFGNGAGGPAQADISGVGGISSQFFPFQFELNRVGVESGGGTPTHSPAWSNIVSAALSFEVVSTLNSTEIIQSPSILTLNNREARIRIGRTRRFAEQVQSTSSGTTTSTVQEASSSPVEDGIEIIVTPHITTDGYVYMDLDATDETSEFQEFTFGAQSITLPQTSTKEIQTTIMVADGDTAVIGGLLFNQVTEDNEEVPLVSRIPILGWLFRRRADTVQQQNLSIFITPRVVPMDARADLDEQRLFLRERVSGLDLGGDDDEDGGDELLDR